LHLHIEGTFEPELIFSLAQKNNIALKYKSVEELRQAYQFSDLQSFLDIYYAGMSVLRDESDFTELANAYFARAQADGVVHAELFFDPQAHTSRGVSFETVVNGLDKAVKAAQAAYGLSSSLIMCFLRDMSSQSAMETLEQAIQHKDKIQAVGLDSAERGNPPSKFTAVFERALAAGFLTVAHAGEEGPPEYVTEALDKLKVSRIDHGVRSLEDDKLVARLVKEQIPLTVCPLSNLKLKVVQELSQHNLKKMLELGIMATINSDDPAYFGGYINQNYFETARALALTDEQIIRLAQNSIHASFIDKQQKQIYLDSIAKQFSLASS
jgi:adenosine deaminase